MGHGEDSDGDGYPEWVDSNNDGSYSDSEIQTYLSHVERYARKPFQGDPLLKKVTSKFGWINNYRNAIEAFFGNPRRALFGFILTGIVTAATGAWEYFTNFLLAAFGFNVSKSLCGGSECLGPIDIPRIVIGPVQGYLIPGLFQPLEKIVTGFNNEIQTAATTSVGAEFAPAIVTGLYAAETLLVLFILLQLASLARTFLVDTLNPL